MAGDALSLVENLDRLVGDADVDEFADQPERRGIPVAVDFDMVVGGDAAALPDGEGVGLVGQRLQRRLVDGRKEFDTARIVTLRDADVDVADIFSDRDVEVGGAEEPPIAQPRQNPALGDQDRLLDLGLLARFLSAAPAGSPRRSRRRTPGAPLQARLVAGPARWPAAWRSHRARISARRAGKRAGPRARRSSRRSARSAAPARRSSSTRPSRRRTASSAPPGRSKGR